jgi:hypothetical protein
MRIKDVMTARVGRVSPFDTIEHAKTLMRLDDALTLPDDPRGARSASAGQFACGMMSSMENGVAHGTW